MEKHRKEKRRTIMGRSSVPALSVRLPNIPGFNSQLFLPTVHVWRGFTLSPHSLIPGLISSFRPLEERENEPGDETTRSTRKSLGTRLSTSWEISLTSFPASLLAYEQKPGNEVSSLPPSLTGRLSLSHTHRKLQKCLWKY